MIFDALRRWLGRGPLGPEEPPAPGREGGPSGLSCEEALARVSEFLDGELADASHEEVAEHFRVCTRCYPHLAMERSFREAVQRALRGQEPPPALRDRVRALLEQEATAE